jgi:uncharacterized OB-fold protein
MKVDVKKVKNTKLLIRKCHKCGQMTESSVEQEKCPSCGKSFLPLRYFEKIHGAENTNFKELFSETDDLCEEDLVKGIFVLW